MIAQCLNAFFGEEVKRPIDLEVMQGEFCMAFSVGKADIWRIRYTRVPLLGGCFFSWLFGACSGSNLLSVEDTRYDHAPCTRERGGVFK
jgi:hypothetical protein